MFQEFEAAAPGVRVPQRAGQARLISTSMLPRDALEYGQIWCAVSTSDSAALHAREL